MSVKTFISPNSEVPISKVAYSVSLVRLNTVNGTPILLLKFPLLDNVLPFCLKIDANISFVVVFPLEPVIATEFKRLNLFLYALASCSKANEVSFTFTSDGRVGNMFSKFMSSLE